MNNLCYLASPYSAPTANQRTRRFKKVCQKAAELMEEGYQIFCPIAHSHPIETLGMKEIHDGPFWLEQDFAILEHCTKMFVYCIPGWEQSKGVTAEIAFCKEQGIPVEYIV